MIGYFKSPRNIIREKEDRDFYFVFFSLLLGSKVKSHDHFTMEKPIKIVRLDGMHAPSPTFSIPHTYVEFPLTPSDPATIVERIGDADVVITTRYLPSTSNPSLNLIFNPLTGTRLLTNILPASQSRNKPSKHVQTSN